MNPFNPECPQYFPYNGSGSIFNRLGDHCFYQPTALYAQT
jgi:N-acetylmuramoyl-L-alanine amidase